MLSKKKKRKKIIKKKKIKAGIEPRACVTPKSDKLYNYVICDLVSSVNVVDCGLWTKHTIWIGKNSFVNL